MRSLSCQVNLALLLVGVMSTMGTGAHAQTTTAEPNTILRLGTGWNSDAFGIQVNRPIVNPANCSVADGYMSEAPHNGHKAHYAAALMAFATGRQLYVTVSNTICVHGRPAIIGLQVV
jgi:hypothetical protein